MSAIKKFIQQAKAGRFGDNWLEIADTADSELSALVAELDALNTRLADANSLIYELAENPSMGLTPKAHDRIQEYWSMTK